MSEYAPGHPYPVSPQVQGVPSAHPARSTATAALWCSVLGFLCFPVLGSVLGIVLGHTAARRGYPGGRALAATVLGWAGLVLGLLALAYEGLTRLLG
jgi:hypothetical protein